MIDLVLKLMAIIKVQYRIAFVTFVLGIAAMAGYWDVNNQWKQVKKNEALTHQHDSMIIILSSEIETLQKEINSKPCK